MGSGLGIGRLSKVGKERGREMGLSSVEHFILLECRQAQRLYLVRDGHFKISTSTTTSLGSDPSRSGFRLLTGVTLVELLLFLMKFRSQK
jgi:hypothetical protein